MLDLLESVERDGEQTQRRLATELGVALGLVNAYLRRCVSKGLVKVREAPAHRYAYYLTPKGFAEKSRLTAEYLSYSFSFLRRAREAYAETLRDAQCRGFQRLVLAGVSELAEIAVLCAIDDEIEIIAIVDGHSKRERFVGCSVVESFSRVPAKFDAVILTDLQRARETYAAAAKSCGQERVFVPAIFGFDHGNNRPGVGRS